MNPVATLELETDCSIVVELLPDIAPQAVRSFIALAKQGVFDGHAVERVAPGRCIDCSCSAFGRKEARYFIRNDADSGEYLPMEFGVVAMGGYNEGISGSEFFFPLDSIFEWSGKYPVFGLVREGLDELRRIEQVDLISVTMPYLPGQTIEIQRPKVPELIVNVKVNTFGVEYPQPEKLTDIDLPVNWTAPERILTHE